MFGMHHISELDVVCLCKKHN